MAKKKGFIREFREFCSRGNIFDIAIGMVIATAFTAIVSSLVDDIIMPLIGIIIGKVDFTGLSITVGDAQIMYGSFIQACVNFLLIALTIFICVKVAATTREKIQEHIRLKELEKEEEAPEIPQDIQLLTEIRDLLKKEEK